MEIMISDGTVREVRGGTEAPNTPQVILARAIANLLPLKCVRAGAKVVHNADASYTGIRFETRSGAVVLEMPANRGDGYRVVHERLTDTAEERFQKLMAKARRAEPLGRLPEVPEFDPAAPDPEPIQSVQIAQFISLYKPAGIAFMIGELLTSRGFLSASA